MSFHFRLSSIQKLRENTRDEQRITLAGAMKSVDEITVQFQALEIQAKKMTQEKDQLLRTGSMIPFSALQAYDRREKWLHDERLRLQELLNDAEQNARHCHSALMEADKNLKSLEKLEEKQREQHDRRKVSR